MRTRRQRVADVRHLHTRRWWISIFRCNKQNVPKLCLFFSLYNYNISVCCVVVLQNAPVYCSIHDEGIVCLNGFLLSICIWPHEKCFCFGFSARFACNWSNFVSHSNIGRWLIRQWQHTYNSDDYSDPMCQASNAVPRPIAGHSGTIASQSDKFINDHDQWSSTAISSWIADHNYIELDSRSLRHTTLANI